MLGWSGVILRPWLNVCVSVVCQEPVWLCSGCQCAWCLESGFLHCPESLITTPNSSFSYSDWGAGIRSIDMPTSFLFVVNTVIIVRNFSYFSLISIRVKVISLCSFYRVCQ